MCFYEVIYIVFAFIEKIIALSETLLYDTSLHKKNKRPAHADHSFL